MRCLNENALKRVEIMRLFRKSDSTNSPPFFCFQRKALWEILGACGLMGVCFRQRQDKLSNCLHVVRSADFFKPEPIQREVIFKSE